MSLKVSVNQSNNSVNVIMADASSAAGAAADDGFTEVVKGGRSKDSNIIGGKGGKGNDKGGRGKDEGGKGGGGKKGDRDRKGDGKKGDRDAGKKGDRD